MFTLSKLFVTMHSKKVKQFPVFTELTTSRVLDIREISTVKEHL